MHQFQRQIFRTPKARMIIAAPLPGRKLFRKVCPRLGKDEDVVQRPSWIAQLPSDTKQHNLSFIVRPFERMLSCHDLSFSTLFPGSNRSALFLQHSPIASETGNGRYLGKANADGAIFPSACHEQVLAELARRQFLISTLRDVFE